MAKDTISGEAKSIGPERGTHAAVGAHDCLHPFCPIKPNGAPEDWKAAIDLLQRQKVFGSKGGNYAEELRAHSGQLQSLGEAVSQRATFSTDAFWRRLLKACPCLAAQVDAECTAEARVHLSEVSIGKKLDGSNVEEAFKSQLPNKKGDIKGNLKYPPFQWNGTGGAVAEAFCKRLLINGGFSTLNWRTDTKSISKVEWTFPGFVDLNRGASQGLKSYGDLLIPAAPSNILISCKTMAARERLLNSGIRVDTVGFGFFNTPSEFWTESKLNTLRRFGFTAIYMPAETLQEIKKKLGESWGSKAMNVNATPLYRPLAEFVADMSRVCAGISLRL